MLALSPDSMLNSSNLEAQFFGSVFRTSKPNWIRQNPILMQTHRVTRAFHFQPWMKVKRCNILYFKLGTKYHRIQEYWKWTDGYVCVCVCVTAWWFNMLSEIRFRFLVFFSLHQSKSSVLEEREIKLAIVSRWHSTASYVLHSTQEC